MTLWMMRGDRSGRFIVNVLHMVYTQYILQVPGVYQTHCLHL